VANGIVDRTRHKTRGGGPPLDESQARLEEVSGGTDADGELRRALSGALLVSVMRRVRDQVVARNPPQWESFERHWLGGRPAAAVAEDLGISVDLVYQNASRILKALRRELSVEGAEELLP
jgi:DNA-directed RNA polymerase specialized sigma24 family protein